MTESISELRKICQETRETVYYKMPWFSRHVTRKVSIYFTKLCLKIGISANQASIIGLISTISAGVFLIFAEPRYWLIGILLRYGSCVFDCVDGEIARYNNSSSLGGQQLDYSIGTFAVLYVLSCVTFGIYNSLHSSMVFIFGFLAVIAYAFGGISYCNLLTIFYRKGLFPDRRDMPKIKKEPRIIHSGRILYRSLVYIPGLGFIPQLLVVTIIDCFISPFTILSFSFNARFIYLMLVGLGTLTGVLARTCYEVITYGKIKS